MIILLASLWLYNAVVTPFLPPSLENKIGQMMIVGFQGYEVNEEVTTYVKKYHIGGVVLINRGIRKERIPNINSPEQLATLTKKLKKLDSTLFIAVDQEGGLVSRLNKSNNFFEETPLSALELGQLEEQEAYSKTYEMAKVLKKYGINLNFAPVVDVHNNNNPVIGKNSRAFSADINKVYNYAKNYIKAHQENNIISSIKHFPGHGNSLSDSHLGIADITKTWQEKELLPYELLIRNDSYNDMVMIGHLFNEKIDSSYPSSLSQKFIKEILRKDLLYNGVVVVDSIDMQAISDEYLLKEAVISSINAGADIILYVNNNNAPYNKNIVKNIHDIIVYGVKRGEISVSRIEESYARIIALKKRYGIIEE